MIEYLPGMCKDFGKVHSILKIIATETTHHKNTSVLRHLIWVAEVLKTLMNIDTHIYACIGDKYNMWYGGSDLL